MGWKLTGGIDILGSIENLPGRITIDTEEEHAAIVTNIIKPWDVEMIMGVKYALDGKDNTELEYIV